MKRPVAAIGGRLVFLWFALVGVAVYALYKEALLAGLKGQRPHDEQ